MTDKCFGQKVNYSFYQRLIDKRLPAIYEKKLILKEVEKLPDFTIENPDTGLYCLLGTLWDVI